jgi:hypothetical protein
MMIDNPHQTRRTGSTHLTYLKFYNTMNKSKTYRNIRFWVRDDENVAELNLLMISQL